MPSIELNFIFVTRCGGIGYTQLHGITPAFTRSLRSTFLVYLSIPLHLSADSAFLVRNTLLLIQYIDWSSQWCIVVVAGKRRVMAHGVLARVVLVRGAGARGAGGRRPAVQLAHRAHAHRYTPPRATQTRGSRLWSVRIMGPRDKRVAELYAFRCQASRVFYYTYNTIN